MEVLILVVHVIVALGIIALVLLQHGKGADMGAAFGSGSAGSVFGSSGSANFMSRTTAILAAIFFISSIGLTVFATKKADNKGVMTKSVDPTQSQSMPGQIPTPPMTTPVPVVPVPAAPGSASGSKAGDVPK